MFIDSVDFNSGDFIFWRYVKNCLKYILKVVI